MHLQLEVHIQTIKKDTAIDCLTIFSLEDCKGGHVASSL